MFNVLTQDELDEKVHDLCGEFAAEQMNQTADEDEQDAILCEWESKGSEINNQGRTAQVNFLQSH